MLTPTELQQIRRLHLQLKRRVDSPFAGGYRSAFRGQGMEFEEVRPYVSGDDVRHIDWNVTARTGTPHIKVFREERELTLMLVLDRSGSVRAGAGGRDGHTDKGLQIARLAGALAWAAVRNGDRVGMLTFTDGVETFLPPRRSRGHAWAVLRAAFDAPPERRGTNLSGALEHLGRVLRRRAVVCVMSDFISPEPFDRAIGILSQKHQVSCFVVHDPLESAMPNVGLVELEDAETGRRRLVDAATLTSSMPVRERLQRVRKTGAWATSVSTAEDPYRQLLAHFHKLERSR